MRTIEEKEQEARDLYALTRIPGLGPTLIRQLLAYCGSVEAIFRSRVRDLKPIPGIGPVLAGQILGQRDAARLEAESEWKKGEALGVQYWACTQPGFPSRLNQIADAPVVLFGLGRFRFEAPRILAVVGTRQATSYGKESIDSFLEQLLPYQPVVVSGLAYGIDGAAHRQAHRLGLETWAVMATGLDCIYPGAHHSLAASIQENGGLLTENPLGTGPDAPRFPARNRIIAGLSDAILVVEAREKGGALITARLGQDYYRDVFALPGPAGSPASRGCHDLIRFNVAALADSGLHLAQAMGWTEGKSRSAPAALSGDLFANEEQPVMALLMREKELPMDELAWKTSIPVNQLASLLLGLEFRGWVKSLPGKRFALSNGQI